MIFDRSDHPFFPPINRIWQLIAGAEGVAVAGLLRAGGEPSPPIDLLDAEKPGPELVVGEIGEPVEAETEGPVGAVVGVDEAKVVLEDLEPGLLLAEGVVGLGVLDEPRLVDGPHLRLGPLGGGDHHAVLGVVVDDRHVRRGGTREADEKEKDQKGTESRRRSA